MQHIEYVYRYLRCMLCNKNCHYRKNYKGMKMIVTIIEDNVGANRHRVQRILLKMIRMLVI